MLNLSLKGSKYIGIGRTHNSLNSCECSFFTASSQCEYTEQRCWCYLNRAYNSNSFHMKSSDCCVKGVSVISPETVMSNTIFKDSLGWKFITWGTITEVSLYLERMWYLWLLQLCSKNGSSASLLFWLILCPDDGGFRKTDNVKHVGNNILNLGGEMRHSIKHTWHPVRWLWS